MQKCPPIARTSPGYGDDYSAKFRQIVMGYPLDAHCVAEAGCDNTVAFHVDYHGCVEELVCAEHLSAWANQVNVRIVVFGSVVCMDCGQEFTSASDFGTARTA